MTGKGKCTIYLADLTHNYAAKGPHNFPINIGYIASYAKKVHKDKIEVKLFKYPLDLIRAIEKNKPHIVGFGNYTWNLDINNKIVSWIKSFAPDIVTVYGGPDYPINCEEALIYFKERPDMDFYAMRQGEGGFSSILDRYFISDTIDAMKASPIQNCSFHDKAADKIIVSDKYIYIEDLDEIPSPYLTGLMDEYFEKNLIPMIETNRGCPYSCTYCAWGNSTRGKILPFSLERVKQELEYIAKRARNTNLLKIADANFGILKRDIEISQHIKFIMDKYGYPWHLAAGWAKNVDRVIKMTEAIGKMVSVTCSFQTMDPVVMKNVKRTNISVPDLRKAYSYFNKRGISAHTEMILALPGETKKSHLEGLKQLFDCDVASMQCYNLRMLGGTELSTAAGRKSYNIETKYRLIDGGFGRYNDIVSIEAEEMVTSTSTMTMDDILFFRPVHFLIQFLWDYNYYKDLLYFIKNQDINPVDFVITILENTKSAPPPVRKIFDDFHREAYNEWFDTKDELFEYYSMPENFSLISKGGFGKLNFKYTYRFLLECKDDFGQYLFTTAGNLLSKNEKLNDSTKEQLDELARYTQNVYIDLATALEEKQAEKALEFKYDILKWKGQSCKNPLSEYKTQGIRLNFELSDEQSAALKKLYLQFKSENINQTLRKMVEVVKNKKDLFYNVNYVQKQEVK